jgi:hypothetical protein
MAEVSSEPPVESSGCASAALLVRARAGWTIGQPAPRASRRWCPARKQDDGENVKPTLDGGPSAAPQVWTRVAPLGYQPEQALGSPTPALQVLIISPASLRSSV